MSTPKIVTSSPKIIVHWLNQSRANYIIWFLEELGLTYEVKVYERDKNMRAPEELKKIHPLGKSPVLEVDGEILAESGYMMSYLLKNYDKDYRLTPSSIALQNKVDYYLHYSEGSFHPPEVMLVVLNVTRKKLPFGIKFLGGKILDAIADNYALPEVVTHLNYLENNLEGQEYFCGDKLSAADIILSFPLRNSLKLLRNPERERKNYPNVLAWLDRISKREGYKKAQEMDKEHPAKF
ncbi:Glutathione S-transferase [Komagataella phaffii CBS 7435]|uniref:glutathione transferase n=2 Tax=Komagataella phaffii TaxID=460519 RepID=C4R2T6_KOMPG|nr:ER associated glutathione S-transferase capable of homodimerization [Komagataella phaffii GS115]CAH2447634.1 Glutathione S-transferase [Komagataella phaffii CBS 7435]CAY69810.1 ER associated glutathione S-transferase capable of homodimerization [Komagataella phaffii GS115]CCA37819.1 Glutathione S-transferase [Komagataella phaffii CBS 7435]